jgi:predicted small lipoprotein YifL
MLRDFIARFRMVATALAAAAVGLATLSACGVKGPLKPPPAPGAATATSPDSRPASSIESPAAFPQNTPEPRL